ncbi:hypothetical protein DNTS_021586 [Danionella cerebrum]|uniref:Uncharacterized protein n=1 Tax=Danionella cerebrum TaxID=2873325 RepID=A0A553QXK2_9TELE|nr:hypothetical protein DNTS_021586 [Danionella translucida]
MRGGATESLTDTVDSYSISYSGCSVWLVDLCCGGSWFDRSFRMDRVKSSMQQVPNPIPKVLSRRTGSNSLEVEKENFERNQDSPTHPNTPFQ